MRNKELYSKWKNMRQRCNNPRNKSYSYYGGKGIKVCEEWNSFEAFQEWAFQNGFKSGLSIDRKDNDKDYCPENCRFVSLDEQQRNKCNNRYVEYNGKTYTLCHLARKLKIGWAALKYGLDHGDTIEEILNRKRGVLRTSKLYEYKGKLYTISQLAREANINTTTLEERMKSGLSVAEAVKKPYGYPVRKYEFKGKQYTMKELAEISGLTIGCINQRLLRGYSVEDALSMSIKTNHKEVSK